MNSTSNTRFGGKRLAVDWKLLSSVFLGFVIVSIIAAATPMYLQSLQQISFQTSLDRMHAKYLTFQIFASDIPLTRPAMERVNESLTEAIQGDIGDIFIGSEVYFKTSTNLVGLPSRPLPSDRDQVVGTNSGFENQAPITSRGSFQYLSNLESHSTFRCMSYDRDGNEIRCSGGMPGSEMVATPKGPAVEVAISVNTQMDFDLTVGDVLTLTPDLGSPHVMHARISGVFDKADSDMFNIGTYDGYWDLAHIFLDQAPLGLPPEGEAPPPGINVDPSEPPVVLFVTRDAMLDIIGPTYPGTVTNPIWTLRSDKALLRDVSVGEARERLASFETTVRRGFDDVPLATGPSFGSISGVGGGHEIYFKGRTNLAELPNRPLPELRGTGEIVSRGSFQHLSNIARHGRFLSGQMAGSELVEGHNGAIIEAAISSATATSFNLQPGEIVTLHWPLNNTTTIASPIRLSAKISGVFEKANPDDPFWDLASGIFDQPPLGIPPDGESPPEGVVVDPDEPPVVLFITRDVMVDVYSELFPEGLISPVWTVPASQTLRQGTPSDQNNVPASGFETPKKSFSQVTISMGPVQNLIEEINRKSFFSSVPLLLLSAAMVVTILFYVSMLVGYLVQGRTRDAALLRSRGMGSVKMARIYVVEGLLMALVSAAVAVPLATFLVSFAGKLPYFAEVTSGDTLPVLVSTLVLIAISITSIVCFLIYLLPPLAVGQASPLIQKLRTSRPPSIPFMHRYYIDLALVVAGGLFYWELQARGQFISGGLFGDAGVNEALLFAPGVFMIVTALVFLRLFPLFVRFLNGDSLTLAHVIAAFSVMTLTLGLLLRAVTNEGIFSEVLPTVLVVGVGLTYRLTHRISGPVRMWLGFATQAAFIAGFLYLDPVESDGLLYIPTIGLLSLLPIQITFLFLQTASRSFPIWISIGLSRMARNPLQYTWLVLLLVLSTGLGMLATTVGGTLQQSQEDRIRYELPTDMRVTGIPLYTPGGLHGVVDRYLESPDIVSASLGLRTSGSVNGRAIQIFALESTKLEELGWYFREDFSDNSLNEVMSTLRSSSAPGMVSIPAGATKIGLWAKPDRSNPNLAIWLVLEDQSGRMKTVSMGKLGHSDWKLHMGDMPTSTKGPFELVSVQLFRSGVSVSARAGTLWLDDLYVTTDDTSSVWLGEERLIMDFEHPVIQWMPIITSALSRDEFKITNQASYRGNNSGMFTYGTETSLGVRGFYRSPSGSGGYLPVIISESLANSTGYGIGDTFIAEVMGRDIPVIARGSVSYFPTVLSGSSSFILSDLNLMLRVANLVGNPAARSTTQLRPNEIFLRKTSSSEPIGQVLDDATLMIADIDDSGVKLESLRRDPFSTAGWSGAVLLSLFVMLISATFGYISYLLIFAIKSTNEMGFLKAMGLSRLQMIISLGFEHLGIAGLAVGVGVWTGIQMSRLMVSPLAITESGQPVLPPFILITDWGLLMPTFAVLGIIFIAALIALGRSLDKIDLNTMARGRES